MVARRHEALRAATEQGALGLARALTIDRPKRVCQRRCFPSSDGLHGRHTSDPIAVQSGERRAGEHRAHGHHGGRVQVGSECCRFSAPRHCFSSVVCETKYLLHRMRSYSPWFLFHTPVT